MATKNEIVIEETPRAFKAVFPYKHEIGWRGFKQVGMWFKEPQNIGGSASGVFWFIPKEKLDAALDVIQYWYTENPLIGHPEYGVRVQRADETSVMAAPAAGPAQWQVAA